MKVIVVALLASVLLSFGLQFILTTNKTPSIEKINIGKYKTVLENSKDITQRNNFSLEQSQQKSSFFDNTIIKQVSVDLNKDTDKDKKKQEEKK